MRPVADWRATLQTDRTLLCLAAALSAHSLELLLLRAGFLHASRDLAAGSVIGDDEINALLEELELALSTRAARADLTDAGLLEASASGELRLAAAPRPAWITDADATLLEPVDAAALRSVLEPDQKQGRVAPSPRRLVMALARARAWALEIADVARDLELVGLPVFWVCAPDGASHQPLAQDPGSMATTDGLLICAAGLAGASIASDARRGLRWAWDRVLDLQHAERAWDRGALMLPGWDDDFVGTFDPAHADRGPCPTTDAAANAVIALAQLLRTRAETHLDDAAELRDRTAAGIRAGAACVRRWQLAEGGWGIYRFDPEGQNAWPMPTRDMSSRYALEALAEAVAAGDDREPNRAAAERYAEFVVARAATTGDQWWWYTDFRASGDVADAVRATATVAPTLGMLETLGVDSERLREARAGAFRFLATAWQPEPAGYAAISFRVPTWTGPGSTFTWELPRDPMIVSALTGDPYTFELIDDALATRLDAVVGEFVELQLHAGHWVDFVMLEEEGERRGMTGNSRHYVRAFLDYLRWQWPCSSRVNLIIRVKVDVTLELCCNTRMASLRHPGDDDFLEVGLKEVDRQIGRVAHRTPTEVLDSAGDATRLTLMRRKFAGIEGFRDRRGRLRHRRVRAYTARTFGGKYKDAWRAYKAQPRASYEDAVEPATSRDWAPGSGTRLPHRRGHRAAARRRSTGDEHLAKAQDELRRFDERIAAEQLDRMAVIRRELEAAGASPLGTKVVLRRAARGWSVEVTEDGLRACFARAPRRHDSIAAELGVTHAQARQAYGRALDRVPAWVEDLVKDPVAPTEPCG